MSKLVIIKALLSKQVSRGCTVGEEEAAVAKAVELMGKYAIPHSAVASVWPKGWDFHGKRVVQPQRDALDDFMHKFKPRTVKVSPKDIADLEEFLRRTGSAKGFKTKAKPAQGKPGTLGDYARQLLMSNIDGIGPYSYGYILGRIMDRYPDAKTTVASLRWYENEMRKQGRTVPKGRPAKG